MAIGRTNTGGGGGLNFRIIGGTVQPTSAKENDIWVNTDTKIPSWFIGTNEPNVYDIQPISVGDPHCLIAPHPLSEGDILNFEIPATADAVLEAVRIRDVSTGKDYCVRSTAGEAVPGWYKGIKLCVMISNDINKVGDWAMHGTAYWIAWGAYYNKEGTVWIPTGTSSTFEFNALKKNSIMVYPLSVSQYIDGAWVKKSASMYKNGTWVSWLTDDIVFDRSNQSFSAISDKLHIVDDADYSLIIDQNPYIELQCRSGSEVARAWQWETAIDFSKYKTLEVTGYSTGGKFGVASSLKTVGNQEKVTELASMNFSGSDSVHTLDISGIDTTAYIGFYADVKKSVFVKKVKLM